ncbi:MAG: hypothetical protein NVS4B11_13500 [Ktedonobacteraceae bacterium]
MIFPPLDKLIYLVYILSILVLCFEQAIIPFPALATWYKPSALASARALYALKPSRLAVGHGVVLTDPLPAMAQAIAVAEQTFDTQEKYATQSK